MSFTIQITVGETLEEITKRALEDLQKYERGEEYVIRQISFLSWDMFYAMLSPEGYEHMKPFIDKYRNEDPTVPHPLNLQDLLSGVTQENIHNRLDFGKPVGKELF